MARAAVPIATAAAVLAAAAAVLAGPVSLAIPLAAAGVLFLVRRPYALLALYVFIGPFKDNAALVQAAPFDLTVGLGALLAIVCLVRAVAGKGRSIPPGFSMLLLVLSIAAVVSVGWSLAPDYGGAKAEKFLTLTLLAAIAPFFVIEGEADLRRFFYWVVGLAVVASVLALTSGPPDPQAGLEDRIGNSQLACAAALTMLLVALGNPTRRAWAMGIGIGLIVVAATIGERGPILGVAVALCATATAWVLRAPRKVLPVLCVVGVGVAAAPFVSLPETSSERLAAAARDPVGTLEADSRTAIYRQAIDVIQEHPLRGAGIGGFEAVDPVKRWPHNLFLELWAELGLVPLLVAVASFIAVLVGLFRGAWLAPEGGAQELVYIVLAVTIFYLVTVQVSGDINNRPFWALLGVAWLVAGDRLTPAAHRS